MSALGWLAALLGAPVLATIWALVDRDAGRTRVAAGIGALLASGAAAIFAGADLAAFTPLGRDPLFGGPLVAPGALGKLLVVLPPVLWAVTVIATPTERLGRAGLGRVAAGAGLGVLAFLSESPLLLAAVWGATSALFVWGIARPANGRSRRVIGIYQVVSGALLLGGLAARAAGGADDPLGLWLVVAAVLVRKGIFPFHAWIPEAFDQGRIGPSVMFCAPQLGSWVAAVLVLPHAAPEVLRTVAILSLTTAVYGAALALFQADARRAVGYLFVSQSALVLAGLDCASEDALTGALVLWVASAVAFTGFARAVLALEARRGRQALTRSHGGFDQVPLLAASFLLFGLACTGFPGTLGFVGQELLVDGAVRSFPAMGFLVIAASALTGIAVLRMYLALFCGRPGVGPPLRLRRREALVFGGLAAFLVLTGVAPRAIVESRIHATEALLHQRAAIAPAPPKHAP